MVELHEGQQWILGTNGGLLKLISRFDQPSAMWQLSDRRGEPVFQVSSDGSLVPLQPMADTITYFLHDLHEWGSRA